MRRKADPAIGLRMVEEIDRIFSDRKMAAWALNVHEEAMKTWEEGGAPSVCYLQVLCSWGGDVIYVLTGKRREVATK